MTITSTIAPDVLVVGGGIIGLAAAERLRCDGLAVTVLDAGEPGAWSVAAGMLAPVTEADFEERDAAELGVSSLALYRDFCARLGVALSEAGTLVVARDADEAAALKRLDAFRASMGFENDVLLPSAARRLEPALAPTIRRALLARGDLSVDPRALVAALRDRVPVQPGRGVRVTAHEVELEDGRVLAAERVVVATGARGLGLDVVRPVKGQVLRLRDPRGPGLVERTIRGETAYLVPRADGRYVLGATVEERGWDAMPTAAGVFELLRDMSEIVPGILEFEVEEINVGFRPGTPDNLPIVGALDGVIHATGHWRNGVLLAPLTADLVAGIVRGEEPPKALSPKRFAGVPV